jgi:diaminopimelate epimerase
MIFRSRSSDHTARIEEIEGDQADVTVSMTDPIDPRPERRIDLGNRSLSVGTVDTGVPHAVLRVESLSSIDVSTEGRLIRNHEAFGGSGANVDFIEFLGSGTIRVRTYERGVEDETLSCGTGAVASAVMAAIWENLPGPVRVATASGKDLLVTFDRTGDRFHRVTLRGEARVVYRAKTGAI